MNELAVATIHFIGLALFSTQVPGEQGLRVLLPRVEAHHQMTHYPKAETPDAIVTTTIKPDNIQAPARIEPHIAAVVYDETAFLQEIGWTSEDLPAHMVVASATAPKYRMVRLDGERVTFHAHGMNPLLAGGLNLALPKPACAKGFVPKFSIAGMVAIPGGKLSTCVVQDRDRYDTQLTLDNNGVLTVWAQTSDPEPEAKALILRGNATVYVVNVPTSALTMTAASGNPEHYLAYYDLVRASSTPDCPRKLLLPIGVKPCPSSSLQIASAMGVGTEPGLLGIKAVNAECSNSTWP